MIATQRLVLCACAMLLALAGTAWAQERSEPRPWLGVYLMDEIDGGIRIVAVVPGGPASRAGLRTGDLLLEVADAPLADQAALERVLLASRVGEALSFGFLRDGRSLASQIVPERRPVGAVATPPRVPASPVAPIAPTLAPSGPGLEVVEMPTELRRHFGASGDHGVLVVRLDPGGTAVRAGFRVGDVLTRAAGTPLSRRSDLDLAWLRRDNSAVFNVDLVRQRVPRRIEVPASAPPFATAARVAVKTGALREARRRHLEASIAALERRLQALRRELGDLEEATPDREANPEP